MSLSNICKLIFRNALPEIKQEFISMLVSALQIIQSSQLLTIVLNELSQYLNSIAEIENTIEELRKAIGALPLEKKKEEEKEELKK